MADLAFNPQLPTQQPSTTPEVYQPNENVVNPLDGKSYQVRQQTPGKGITVVDPTTSQEMIVPENQVGNLKPAVRTTSVNATSLASSILNELIGEELPVVQSSIERKKLEIEKMQEGSRKWIKVRAALKSERQLKEAALVNAIPTDRESRQVTALRSYAVNYKGRDQKTHIPLAEGETDKVDVGLTEFPKDVEKVKDAEGYGKMTMEEMDAKFLEEHEHFNNEKKLPSQTMTREEDSDYFKGQEKVKERRKDEAEAVKPRYSSYDEYLDEALGITKKAEGGEITKKPVELKEIKTAPKVDEYYEPEVIPSAQGSVRDTIKKFKETQAEIAKLTASIQAVSKPLQEALVAATTPLQADLAQKAALLSSYITMIHDQLRETDDKVVHMENELFAAVDREQASTPPASLAQIMKRAKETQPEIFTAIGKIKAFLENENTKLVLEQYVYKYPVSTTQQKKLGSDSVQMFIDQAVEVIKYLQLLNSEL